MPIRNIVTRGFANGTFQPGVNTLPTRGYSLAAIPSPDAATWEIEALQTFFSGAKAFDGINSGADAVQSFLSGATELE
jgi:hypothetical protein